MALHSKAGSVALDRAGLEAASAQHAGNCARQQACAHRLGGPRTRSRLSAEDHCQCLTKARSGPPRGCRPPLCATIAHPIGRASDGGSEGMASPDPCNIKKSNPTRRLSTSLLIASPPRSARWNEEMDERSARPNQVLPLVSLDARGYPCWSGAKLLH